MLVLVLKHGYFPEEISSNMNWVGQRCLWIWQDTCLIHTVFPFLFYILWQLMEPLIVSVIIKLL